MNKEQKFYEALQYVFIGAKIEGEGGFVNLMRIKSNYYRKIEELLKKDIDTALEKYPAFRDELFDKLYSFFSRYFTESGSIYFNSTPFHNNIYEKVYTDEKDVILFWKTQMLYYVKTDRIFRSLEIISDGFKFYFDVSKLEHKKANEKRSLVFELDKVKEDGTIVFSVQYSEKNTKTKQDEILKALKRKGIAITEEQLERAFRVFEKQSEVDFFINKNAKAFLQEQFKLWSYQYFWEGAKEWSADRVNQLQILKDIAFKIIDFISQFEDEKVLAYDKSGISKDVKEYQGGGFFKYYELEQYEEALANCKYEDGDLFNSPLIKGWHSEGMKGYLSGKSPYQEYVFMKDEKMLKCLEIDYENNKVKVDLDKLYQNIDIAETLSNLTGKWIKKITPCQTSSDTPLQEGNYEVEFEDGTKINIKDLDYKLIKPLIWWE